MVAEVPEFLQKLRERRAAAEPTPSMEFDADLIPDITPSGNPERTAESQAIDSVIDKIGILDIYAKYVHKMTPDPKGKRESVMMSCPHPSHGDSNPSAYANLDKDTYHCGYCSWGSDKYGIAAMYLGWSEIEVQNKVHQQGSNFPKLRKMIAEDFGYVVRKTLGGEAYVEQPLLDPEVPSVAVTSEEEPSNVVALFDDEARFDREIKSIYIDWETVVEPDTFLWEWMQACTIDDLPHEYYFWLGMQALGFAAGTDQLMDDFQPVKPNLFVCLYGRTGSGKSRALAPYVELLDEALPYEDDVFNPSTGVKILSSPASAEALLKMFSKELLDPSSMQTVDLAQVRGLLRTEEFAAFIARAARATNPMKETLIELYDVLNRDMRHTSIGGGTVVARNPYCQMVTTTQPAAIHEFLRRSDAHSGFLNRWVFATGQRRRRRISYGGVHIDTAVPATHLRIVKQHCLAPRSMQLKGKALDVWDDFFHAEIVPLHDQSDESMFSRVDLMIKKFILLFTLNDLEQEPTEKIVERAVSLFPYLRRTYMMFSEDISHNEYEECRQEIITAVRTIEEQTKKPASLRQLIQRLNNRYPQNMLASVLKTMIELDELQELLSDNKRGPKSKMYHYAQ